jgi:UDP-2-acetamido-2,6-beta-L-arabino-hexul-4-ose reductase
MRILVTGSSGFIGKHLVEALCRRPNTEVIAYDLHSAASELEHGLREADVIFHLAGVNRPQSVQEFKAGNADLTESLCSSLAAIGSQPLFVLSSSIQAALDNPYGISKREAELSVERWANRDVPDGGRRTEVGGLRAGSQTQIVESGEHKASPSSEIGPSQPSYRQRRAIIFRLKNVFGKWCRPNYNSVTATFCHNISHDLPISISDPMHEIELVYIDDVVAAFLSVLDCDEAADLKTTKRQDNVSDQRSASGRSPSFDSCCYFEVARSFKVTLGELEAKIRAFRASRASLLLPSFADDFTRCLYATYLSYMDGCDFAYALKQESDLRGSLAEFIKQPHLGQLFISRTKPGITRGNHYHHTKTEKFLVVEGEAIIRFRHIFEGKIIVHRVSGKEFKVVDIPPGYAHSIENVGTAELVTLFWASEIFDPLRPDVHTMTVQPS